MKVERCRVRLRPRDPLESFDLALLFLRENRQVLGRLFAVVVVPVAALLGFLAWATDGSWGVLLLALSVLNAVQLPFTVVGAQLLFREEVPPGDGIRALWSAGALRLSMARAAVCLVVPFTLGVGALLALPMSFLPEIVLLERSGVAASWIRALRVGSMGLVGGIASVSGRIALSAWAVVVAELTGQGLCELLQVGQPFGTLWAYAVTPFALFGLIAVQPLHAIYRLLLYLDARTRAEGWDIQVLLWTARRRREA